MFYKNLLKIFLLHSLLENVEATIYDNYINRNKQTPTIKDNDIDKTYDQYKENPETLLLRVTERYLNEHKEKIQDLFNAFCKICNYEVEEKKHLSETPNEVEKEYEQYKKDKSGIVKKVVDLFKNNDTKEQCFIALNSVEKCKDILTRQENNKLLDDFSQCIKKELGLSKPIAVVTKTEVKHSEWERNGLYILFGLTVIGGILLWKKITSQTKENTELKKQIKDGEVKCQTDNITIDNINKGTEFLEE